METSTALHQLTHTLNAWQTATDFTNTYKIGYAAHSSVWEKSHSSRPGIWDSDLLWISPLPMRGRPGVDDFTMMLPYINKPYHEELFLSSTCK